MSVARLSITSLSDTGERLSDEVELYQRTYTTLLRSSGETRLRVLEPSHRAMRSSLHSLAASEELDLGAFLYAISRLPQAIAGAQRVVMGQSAEALIAGGLDVSQWPVAESPARRRRWYVGPDGLLAVLLASSSDVDDLVPTLVAYQIEWNKIRLRLTGAASTLGADPDAASCAQLLSGTVEDWQRLREAWGPRFAEQLAQIREHHLSIRIRMLGGSHTGYARMTRRWWAPVQNTLDGDERAGAGGGQRAIGGEDGGGDQPLYFVSSNTHSLVNIATGVAREREPQLIAFVESLPSDDVLHEELQRFRSGETEGSWENFLYYVARQWFDARGEQGATERREAEAAYGVRHLRSGTALRVSAQVIALSALSVASLDPRLGVVDASALAASRARIVNIDYPLGLAAYNILREVAVDAVGLRGVYVLGKAATLNADVGDVLISSVVHDEHSRSTYWLDNAFSVDDLAADLRFGTGLDNQRAVTVKSTFLQNRAYLDFYYREAFTVVEMEAGPFLNAVYELADPDRFPVGEAVNFSKLPIDLGIIHYASDTPYTQARTLGARGLSYYGMDSTYASSLAILRRILRLEGILG
ncbi:MAG TPA: hypothetical protein VFN36_02255 [Solirubrobacteraceae bacterium]|nr:hypothetical protein [Solirubrobacteraceae bacterium]